MKFVWSVYVFFDEEQLFQDCFNVFLVVFRFSDFLTLLFRFILKKIVSLGFCVIYFFFIISFVFFVIFVNIEFFNKGFGSFWIIKFFVFFIIFFLYNFVDLCGRQIIVWIQVFGFRSQVFFGFAFFRICFVFFFVFCNYQFRVYLQTVVFQFDIYSVVFIFLLGFSNGYFSILFFIYGFKIVFRELVEVTGVVMFFYLYLGLVFGSVFFILFVYFIQGVDGKNVEVCRMFSEMGRICREGLGGMQEGLEVGLAQRVSYIQVLFFLRSW